MSAPARLAAFAAGLVLVFGASYVVAGAVVPDRVVDDWTRRAEQPAGHDDPSGAHAVSTSTTPSSATPSSTTPSGATVPAPTDQLPDRTTTSVPGGADHDGTGTPQVHEDGHEDGGA